MEAYLFLSDPQFHQQLVEVYFSNGQFPAVTETHSGAWSMTGGLILELHTMGLQQHARIPFLEG